MSCLTSAAIIGQEHLRNSLLKPLGPGDLSFGKSLMASSISFSEKGTSKESKISEF
jgi:hypothetical protein